MWGVGMVICLERGADLHMTQLMPLPPTVLLTVSCFSKSRLVFPFWYRLTQVVPDKGPLDGCVCVCVYMLRHYLVLFGSDVLSVLVVDQEWIRPVGSCH